MTAIRTVLGPLDDAGLGVVAGLYGRVDAKYASLDYLRHLFVDNPAGWALHAFAYDGETAVGHCAAVPLHARTSDRVLLSGKIEAYFVDERYRGPRDGNRPSLALELLTELSTEAESRELGPLHAYVTPRVGAIFERAGYRPYVTGARPYVAVPPGRERGAAVQALAGAQRVAASLAAAVFRPGPAKAEMPTDDDGKLADPRVPDGAWTVAGVDSWRWFSESGFLAALALPGARAVVAQQGAAQPLHLLGWRAAREDTRAALVLLLTLARVARDRSASAVRVQPWAAVTGERALVRACRILGFAPRAPLTIYVRSTGGLPAEPAASPFFYVTF